MNIDNFPKFVEVVLISLPHTAVAPMVILHELWYQFKSALVAATIPAMRSMMVMTQYIISS